MNPEKTYSQPQIEAYLARIGFASTPEANLATLKTLHQRHQQSIPFENLDVLLGRPISIEPDQAFEKLVTHKRGGYCFEQNTVFGTVLQTIGFKVRPSIARVRWGAQADQITPLSHMVLRVQTGTVDYLCDVGFGGVGLVHPIRFDTSESPSAPEEHRLRKREQQLVHQIKTRNDWKDVYLFTPDTAHPIDLEVGNWFSHTHPNAHFRNALLVSRLTPTGRKIITNTEFVERNWNGGQSRSLIKSQTELKRLLHSHFGMDIAPQALARIPDFLKLAH